MSFSKSTASLNVQARSIPTTSPGPSLRSRWTPSKLQRAVIIAADNPADPEALDDLRLAFDIFYSRFNILARSDQIAGLPINSQLREQLWSQNAFFERVTPLIDGPDANLSAALPALLDEMGLVSEEVRANVVASLQSLMTASDIRRNELRRSLQVFASASIGLLGLMAGLSLVIILQNRAQQRRSETTARAVHNLRATIESSLDAVLIAGGAGPDHRLQPRRRNPVRP